MKRNIALWDSRRRIERTESIFKTITADKFLNLRRKMAIQTHEAHRTAVS